MIVQFHISEFKYCHKQLYLQWYPKENMQNTFTYCSPHQCASCSDLRANEQLNLIEFLFPASSPNNQTTERTEVPGRIPPCILGFLQIGIRFSDSSGGAVCWSRVGSNRRSISVANCIKQRTKLQIYHKSNIS